jgi:hypothetical protein
MKSRKERPNLEKMKNRLGQILTKLSGLLKNSSFTPVFIPVKKAKQLVSKLSVNNTKRLGIAKGRRIQTSSFTSHLIQSE